MEEFLAKKQVSETGRMLLKKQLIARTWGNFSARIDNFSFAITPSGLGYQHMMPEDVVIYNMDDSFVGTRKPSSEKKIHKVAYEIFSDTNFVIHTHQIYATALGLTGKESLVITDEEIEKLGGIGFSKYGLPGTDELKDNIKGAFLHNAHTVFMQNHGVVICAKDRDQAILRAELLEDICKRSCLCQDDIMPNHKIVAQLDDMAQMIGRVIPFAKNKVMANIKLKFHNVVICKDIGLLVNGKDEDDTMALKLLSEKAIISEKHAEKYGKYSYISLIDCLKMRYNYLHSYSKRKNT